MDKYAQDQWKNAERHTKELEAHMLQDIPGASSWVAEPGTEEFDRGTKFAMGLFARILVRMNGAYCAHVEPGITEAWAHPGVKMVCCTDCAQEDEYRVAGYDTETNCDNCGETAESFRDIHVLMGPTHVFAGICIECEKKSRGA